jgi:hypothetical protein
MNKNKDIIAYNSSYLLNKFFIGKLAQKTVRMENMASY